MKDMQKMLMIVCCFLSFEISLITITVTTSEMEEVKKQNTVLQKEVDILNKNILTVKKQNEKSVQQQDKTIETYKKYVDGVVYNITGGKW